MSAEREERIRQQAHAIWLREGQPEGESARHWLQAEGDIDAEDKAGGKPSAKRAATPKAAKPEKAKPAAAKKAPARKPAK